MSSGARECRAGDAARGFTLLAVSGTQPFKPASVLYLNPDDLMISASWTGILSPKIMSGASNVTLSAAAFDAFKGATACNDTLPLTYPTITPTTPATITVNSDNSEGFCHYSIFDSALYKRLDVEWLFS